MWFLIPLTENNQDTAQRILLCPNREYVIGRKNADIVIRDSAVSKRHAKIIGEEADTRSVYRKNFKPQLLVEDLGSKFHTFVGGVQVETAIYLANRDYIRFGLNVHLRLAWDPVVVCLSSRSSVDRTAVEERAAKLGIPLKREWDIDCTHLFMTEIDDTDTFILCLTRAKHVVSLAWFDALLESASSDNFINFVAPAPEHYLPPIKKGCSINIKPEDCYPKDGRSDLFVGLEFWFFDDQLYKKWEPVVQSAGGEAKQCSLRRKYTIDAVTAEHRIIVAPKEGRRQTTFQEISAKLKDRGRRYIEIKEIGEAIIACSTEKACNPRLPGRDSDDYYCDDDPLAFIDESDPSTALSRMHAQHSHARDVTQTSAHTTATSALDDIFDDLLGDDNDEPLPAPSQLKSQRDDTQASQALRAAPSKPNPASAAAADDHSSTPVEPQPPSPVLSSPPLQPAPPPSIPITAAPGADQQHPTDAPVSADDSSSSGRPTHRIANDVTPARQLVMSRPQRSAIRPAEAQAEPINTKRFRKGQITTHAQLFNNFVRMRAVGVNDTSMRRTAATASSDEDNNRDPFADVRIRVARVTTLSRRGRR